MSSCNVHHESTVFGRGASTIALCIFLYMQSCRVTPSRIQISPIRRCCLMVTMNQLYLVKGGSCIIALHSLLYLQPCRVTAIGISPCRISLTNLPLLLHVWYKSHKFAAVAVHRCISRLGGQKYFCLKSSPLTKKPPAAVLPAVPYLFPFLRNKPPTCEGISYTKCSAAFAKYPQCNSHPAPCVSPPPLLR
jgi:hypothetical protein